MLANGPATSTACRRQRPRLPSTEFAETEPISTYLIAFAAGPWATVTSSASKRPITMYVRKSRVAEAES